MLSTKSMNDVALQKNYTYVVKIMCPQEKEYSFAFLHCGILIVTSFLITHCMRREK